MYKIRQCNRVITKIHKKKKKNYECNRNCNFLFCKEHWNDFFIVRCFSKIHPIFKGIIAFAVFFFGVIYPCYQIITAPQSISGILLPISPQETNQYEIDLGAQMRMPIRTKQLQDGFYLTSYPSLQCIKFDSKTMTPDFKNPIKPFDLMLKLVGDELFITLTSRDFDGNIIGRLKNSEWIVKPNDVTAWSAGDDHIEILDKKGNVAFRLEVDSKSIIHIRGYFIKDLCGFYMIDSSMVVSNELSSRNKELFDFHRNKSVAKNEIKYCEFYKNEKNE